ncbi:ATP-dependent DNA ligase [Mesorhizobium neociceri]|uniref:ATP-dependent DNA ligase n=1 Tax=Mesorhizobium neociceri TaxID=1307853 RepID=UPI001F221460|nr:hypothetical protein [Mesorhizobium neociceri]
MPTLVVKPPEGDGWIHEVKFDGYRSQIVRDAGGVGIFTRRGLDWTSKYRELAKAAGGRAGLRPDGRSSNRAVCRLGLHQLARVRSETDCGSGSRNTPGRRLRA